MKTTALSAVSVVNSAVAFTTAEPASPNLLAFCIKLYANPKPGISFIKFQNTIEVVSPTFIAASEPISNVFSTKGSITGDAASRTIAPFSAAAATVSFKASKFSGSVNVSFISSNFLFTASGLSISTPTKSPTVSKVFTATPFARFEASSIIS